jgi:WD40 repeat protein
LRERLTQRGLDAGSALGGVIPMVPLVPPALVQSTIRSALTYKGASLAATSLAKGAITMMFLAKVKFVCVVVLLCGAVGSGAGWMAQGAGTSPKEQPASPHANFVVKIAGSVQPKGSAVDLYGDPLPEGAVRRLGTVHLRAVGAMLALSPDGNTLVGVRGEGKYVSFWDVVSGKLKETRELPSRGDYRAVLSADGRQLVTSALSRNKSPEEWYMEVWDVLSGQLLHKLKVPGVNDVDRKAFSLDGNSLAAVGHDRDKHSIRVWDLTTGKETLTAVVRSADGSVLTNWNRYVTFTPDGKNLLASFAGSDVGIFCWDVVTGKPLWQNKKEGNDTPMPAFSADGKKLLSSAPPLDLASGKAVQLKNPPPLEWAKDGRILAVPDGRTLLVSGPEGVRVWDLVGGKEVRILAGAGDEMVLAPDGKTLITNNGSLQRWDLVTGKPLYPDNFDQGHCEEVVSVIFSADGKRLASAGADGSVRLWDAATGRPIHVWLAHPSRRRDGFSGGSAGTQALDMTPDGRWIVSAGSEERLRAWESVTGKEVCAIPLPERARNEFNVLVYHLRISPNGKTAMALFGAQGRSFMVGQARSGNDWLAQWDLQRGVLLAKRPVDTARSSSLSRDAKTLVLGQSVTNLDSAKELSKIEDDRRFYSTTRDPRDAISPDGSLIAGQCTQQKENGWISSAGVGVWETATGKKIAQFKTNNGACQLSFLPKMRLVAIDDYYAGVQFWDLVTGKVVATRKMPEGERSNTNHGSLASCLAFTPDGRNLATGHADGTILIWNLELPIPKSVRLTTEEIASLWSTLQDADAAKAWQAVWRLTDAPDDSVPFLRNSLKPVPGAPKDVTDPLLADLGSDVFVKREAANKLLKDLGFSAEPALRQRIDANPPLELRQRIEALLKIIGETTQPMTPEILQSLRGVAVLARVNSPQARQVLEGLTKGVDSAPLTAAAKGALGQ